MTTTTNVADASPGDRPRSGVGARAITAVAALALCLYVVLVLLARMKGASSPFAIDGDQPQAVWQYWRYHVDGAIPPGHVLTDYAFVMHAPAGWWALMAGLSTVVEPLLAAKILQVVAWVALAAAVVFAVGRRTTWIVGIAAAALVLRSPDLATVAGGGYARSFGPFLFVLFFGVFLAGWHRATLAVLVVQAALYPSVVIPCGIAYGIACLVRGPMRDRIRRLAGLAVAGVLIVAFGKLQDLRSPSWWGPLVTYEEASEMRAWGPGGRVPDVPHKPPLLHIEQNIERGFRSLGPSPLPPSLRGRIAARSLDLVVPAAFFALVLVIDRVRRRVRHLPPPDDDARVPWQWWLLAGSTLIAYFLVRAVSFKMYLPARQLSHTVSFLLFTGIPILGWCGARALVGQRRILAAVVAIVAGIVPIFFVRGVALEPSSTYKDLGADARIFEAIRKLPLDAEIACDAYICDNVGLFSFHAPYANRNLTHPFRKGYYAESERRLVGMSGALYATSWQELARFSRDEHVDWFVYTTAKLKAPESRMYEPARTLIQPLFRAGKAKGMVLEHPPKEAVRFRWKTFIILDLRKVRELVDAGKLGAPEPAPATTPTAAPAAGK